MSPDPKPIRAVTTTGGNPDPAAALRCFRSRRWPRPSGPSPLGTAADVAALCLELPPLDLTPREGQGAVTPPHPAIDGPGLASFRRARPRRRRERPSPPRGQWAASSRPPPRLGRASGPGSGPPSRIFAGLTPAEGGPWPELLGH